MQVDSLYNFSFLVYQPFFSPFSTFSCTCYMFQYFVISLHYKAKDTTKKFLPLVGFRYMIMQLADFLSQLC